jgi:hypothetical protein
MPMNIQCRARLVPLIALAALLAASLGAPTLARAQTARSVTASARCIDAGAGGQPEVEVTLTNQTGEALTVSYVHGFTTSQVFVPMMRMEEPDSSTAVVIADGTTETVRAPWDDLGDLPGYIGGALVVTNMGALVPVCSERAVDADEIMLGPAPASDEEARQEAVTIAVQTLGRLESWRAYPALYQLLHPDAQAEAPFTALACWYAAQYGLPDEPLTTLVFGNDVDAVAFGPWTWGVTGETYPDAATVDYRQEVGTIVDVDEVASTMHLVEADGQWRWFFGASEEALAALPVDCDLGGAG